MFVTACLNLMLAPVPPRILKCKCVDDYHYPEEHLMTEGLLDAVFLPVLLGDVSVVNVACDVPVRRTDALAANILKILQSSTKGITKRDQSLPSNHLL